MSFGLVYPSIAKQDGIVTGLSLPRYVTLKSNEVKLRVGPGKNYKTIYIYKCINYPVKIIAEFDNWRKVEDVEGTVGWIHQNLISGVNYAIIKKNILLSKKKLAYSLPADESLLFKAPDENSQPIAKFKFNVIAKIITCEKEWCKLKHGNFTGWIRKINLWGVKGGA